MLLLHPMAGMIMSTVLGLTDFADGMVARKYGSNWWGATLDALVDKWYTVCMFTPLVYIGALPWWACAIMMARDGVSTVIRFFGHEMGEAIKTSSFGKIKTNVVMWGCLLAFLDKNFIPEWGATLAFGAGMLGLVIILIGHRFYFKKRWDAALILPPHAMMPSLFFLPTPLAIALSMLVFSLGSLGEYLWAARRVISRALHQVSGARIFVLGLMALAAPMSFALFPVLPDQALVVTIVTTALCLSLLVLLRFELRAAAQMRQAQ